ncbi:MAG: hypothetical protein ACREK1_08580 [Longimicrobiales bacterium]
MRPWPPHCVRRGRVCGRGRTAHARTNRGCVAQPRASHRQPGPARPCHGMRTHAAPWCSTGWRAPAPPSFSGYRAHRRIGRRRRIRTRGWIPWPG